jgi:hypothetical protein
MNYLNIATAWVKSRLGERTSWDGGALIAISILVLVANPVVKLAAWAGLAWGVYTLVKKELGE